MATVEYPPIYAEVVADRGDPYTIDQRYATPDERSRADLIAFLQSRRIKTIDSKPLHQVKTAALRQAIFDTNFQEDTP